MGSAAPGVTASPSAVAVTVAPAAAAPGTPEAVLAAMVEAAQSRPSLLQPLRSARARLDGDVFTLEVAADWDAFASMHEDEYRDLASRAAGRNLKLRIGKGAPATEAEAEPPPSAADVRRERLLKEAQKEPAVQEALDLFDGRLVDVRESKNSA